MADNTIQNWLDDASSVDADYAAALGAIGGHKLRAKRDALLVESDWTQVADIPFIDSKKAEWATYRQALRDLPATASPTINTNEELTNVTFPTKPS